MRKIKLVQMQNHIYCFGQLCKRVTFNECTVIIIFTRQKQTNYMENVKSQRTQKNGALGCLSLRCFLTEFLKVRTVSHQGQG